MCIFANKITFKWGCLYSLGGVEGQVTRIFPVEGPQVDFTFVLVVPGGFKNLFLCIILLSDRGYLLKDRKSGSYKKTSKENHLRFGLKSIQSDNGPTFVSNSSWKSPDASDTMRLHTCWRFQSYGKAEKANHTLTIILANCAKKLKKTSWSFYLQLWLTSQRETQVQMSHARSFLGGASSDMDPDRLT